MACHITVCLFARVCACVRACLFVCCRLGLVVAPCVTNCKDIKTTTILKSCKKYYNIYICKVFINKSIVYKKPKPCETLNSTYSGYRKRCLKKSHVTLCIALTNLFIYKPH